MKFKIIFLMFTNICVNFPILSSQSSRVDLSDIKRKLENEVKKATLADTDKRPIESNLVDTNIYKKARIDSTSSQPTNFKDPLKTNSQNLEKFKKIKRNSRKKATTDLLVVLKNLKYLNFKDNPHGAKIQYNAIILKVKELLKMGATLRTKDYVGKCAYDYAKGYKEILAVFESSKNKIIKSTKKTKEIGKSNLPDEHNLENPAVNILDTITLESLPTAQCSLNLKIKELLDQTNRPLQVLDSKFGILIEGSVIRVFDKRTNVIIGELNHPSEVDSFCITEDCKLISYCFQELRLCDLTTGTYKFIKTKKFTKGTTTVNQILDKIYLMGKDHNNQEDCVIFYIKEFDDVCDNVSLSSSIDQITVCPYVDGAIIQLIAKNTNAVVKELKGHTNSIVAYDISPNNELISYSQGELRIWNPTTGTNRFVKTKDFPDEVIIDQLSPEKISLTHKTLKDDCQIFGINEFSNEETTSNFSSITSNVKNALLKAKSYPCFKIKLNGSLIQIVDTENNVFRELRGHTKRIIKTFIGKDNNLISYSPGELRIWDILTGLSKVKRTNNFIYDIMINQYSSDYIYLMGKEVVLDNYIFDIDEFRIDVASTANSSSSSSTEVTKHALVLSW